MSTRIERKSTGSQAGEAGRPNIVMIVADQMRHDCTGFSGAGLVRTPSIDRIAARGMGFENCFTAIPTCCPARQSLLTGRRPESLGALWNWDITLPVSSIDPSVFTWSQALHDAGYRTGYFGKWHVSPRFDPTAFGFDEYVSLADYAAFRSSAYPDAGVAPDTAPSRDWRGGVDPVDLEDTGTHWLASQAERFLAGRAGSPEPFLLRVDFYEPHLPSRPASEFAGRYRPADVPVWPSFSDDFRGKPFMQLQQLSNWNVEEYRWDEWAPIVARYFAVVEQMDAAIGRILDSLDEHGATANTVVIFTSDHGDMCGAHRMVDKHYVMYDDVVRVPLAICGPSIRSGGSRVERFVTNSLDLAPTLLDLAGVRTDVDFHGRSLLPLLRGEEPDEWPDVAVSSYNGQQFGLYSQRMIRTPKWKYVWNPTDLDELYDLESDPAELRNLIMDRVTSPVVSDLRRRLLDELVRCDDGLVKNDWLRVQLRTGRKLARPACEPSPQH